PTKGSAVPKSVVIVIGAVRACMIGGRSFSHERRGRCRVARVFDSAWTLGYCEPLFWRGRVRQAARVALAVCAIVRAVSFARAAEKGPAYPVAGIGYEYSGLEGATGSRPLPIGDPSASGTNPLYLRLEILWAEAEKTENVFDWGAADAIVDRFRARQHEV